MKTWQLSIHDGTDRFFIANFAKRRLREAISDEWKQNKSVHRSTQCKLEPCWSGFKSVAGVRSMS